MAEILPTWRKTPINQSINKSDIGTLTAGVPQGSVLGPLLFLLCINDIADDIQSLVRLFADDSSLICSSRNSVEIKQILNTDLVHLNIWAKKLLVDFNPQKNRMYAVYIP